MRVDDIDAPERSIDSARFQDDPLCADNAHEIIKLPLLRPHHVDAEPCQPEDHKHQCAQQRTPLPPSFLRAVHSLHKIIAATLKVAQPI
jgi:hypothetical protein